MHMVNEKKSLRNSSRGCERVVATAVGSVVEVMERQKDFFKGRK